MSKNADILKKSKMSINAKKDSTNTNSIAQLKLVEHNPSDDLKSLFYIFFEFISKYGGAHGAVANTPVIALGALLYANSAKGRSSDQLSC
jgi:hypothetical protein